MIVTCCGSLVTAMLLTAWFMIGEHLEAAARRDPDAHPKAGDWIRRETHIGELIILVSGVIILTAIDVGVRAAP